MASISYVSGNMDILNSRESAIHGICRSRPMTCWKPRVLFHDSLSSCPPDESDFSPRKQTISQGLRFPASYRSTHETNPLLQTKDKLRMGGLVEGSPFYSIANLKCCCRTLLQGITMLLPKTGNGTNMIKHDPLTGSIPRICSFTPRSAKEKAEKDAAELQKRLQAQWTRRSS